MDNVYLEMRGITKTFPGVLALKHVSFQVKKGEIHGLVGENGAGKSTLMNILGGVVQPDSGEILIEGKPFTAHNPHEAQAHGIAFIHQELNLFRFMDIAKNIFVSNLPKQGAGTIDYRKLYQEAKNLLDRIGLDKNPKTMVKDLTVAEQQMVEIAKNLSFKSSIMVLDEPTSSLADREIENLFRILRELRNDGVTIIYISHKLNEIFEICDSVTVLRDGEIIDSCPVNETTKEELVQKMVGRKLTKVFPAKNQRHVGSAVLEAQGITKEPYFEDVSFVLRKGEILGLFGLVGAGRSEVARTIMGDYAKDSGKVVLEGKEMHFSHPRQAILKGIGFLTEDRRGEGLAAEMEMSKNVTMAIFWKELRRGLGLDRKEEEKRATKLKSDLRIMTPSIFQRAKFLSGGNQQKVVVAKWLCSHPRVLIVDEPTRGIDVGAKAEIYELVMNLAREGIAIIFISSEIEEIIGMCDRVVVMHEGAITGVLDGNEGTQERIMYLATGGKEVHGEK